MTLKLESLARPRTHELVVEKLREEIFAGRLTAGDRLPGERQLSERLDVSRPSVREALRMLQAQEIIESHPGTGPRSGLIVTANPGRALQDLVSIHVALHSYTGDDLTQARLAIEEQALRILCEESDHARLDKAEALVDAMRQPGLTPEQFHSLDTDFHLSLVAATGSNLLNDFMLALREAVRVRLLAPY
jgi:DNA-binding FadR family transcriptional regulator